MSAQKAEDVLGEVVSRVVWLDETDSTNRVLRELASGGAQHLTVVLTDHQTAGRGRMDRSWFSEKGVAIQSSTLLVFDGDYDQRRVGLCNLAAAVAVAETLVDAGLAASIKWPNDVLLTGRKVAGILSELIEMPEGCAVVLGVGLNVNNLAFPAEMRSKATSLMIETGRTWDRWTLMRSFLIRLEKLIRAPDLVDRYSAHCSTLGMEVSVDTGRGTVSATATGLDEWGGLELSDGRVFHVGDVTHLHQP